MSEKINRGDAKSPYILKLCLIGSAHWLVSELTYKTEEKLNKDISGNFENRTA